MRLLVRDHLQLIRTSSSVEVRDQNHFHRGTLHPRLHWRLPFRWNIRNGTSLRHHTRGRAWSGTRACVWACIIRAMFLQALLLAQVVRGRCGGLIISWWNEKRMVTQVLVTITEIYFSKAETKKLLLYKLRNLNRKIHFGFRSLYGLSVWLWSDFFKENLLRRAFHS